MNVFIFVGPSVPLDEARGELDGVFLPPVGQGDVYRVSRRRPQVIGIIDGYFEHVPSVWHKEILWAMAQGIHVIGSASMGALRAAELAQFGMEGVGSIFESYRDGILEDDDEVAVIHGPAEKGYQASSDAMVNIRATLQAATAASVISAATRDSLLGIAKQLFYPERSYDSVLRTGLAAGAPEPELDRLRKWLPGHSIDQKREDGLAMLRLIRERMAAGLEPKRVRYTFEYTDLWDLARRKAGTLQVDGLAGTQNLLTEVLLEELQLDPDRYLSLQRSAMLRQLALHSTRLERVEVTAAHLERATNAFRCERGLETEKDFERYLDACDLTENEFMHLMQDEARWRWTETADEPAIAAYLPDYLRLTGNYAEVAERAQRKRRVLEHRGLLNPGLADAGLTREELLHWYFECHLRRAVPPDLPAYLHTHGFTSQAAFTRAVLREYLYTERLLDAKA